MNKLLVTFFITVFCLSCEKERDTSFELVKALVNKTDKVLLYSLQTNVRNEYVFSFGNDSIGLSFIKNGKISLPPIGPYDIIIDNANVDNEILYNLSDTSFFEFNLNRLSWNRNDSLYWENISYKVEGNTYHEKHIERLLFTDTLLTIMKKDYSLLEKFKDYYSK